MEDTSLDVAIILMTQCSSHHCGVQPASKISRNLLFFLIDINMASQRSRHIPWSKNRCPLLGDPQLLKENSLPTVEDVLNIICNCIPLLK